MATRLVIEGGIPLRGEVWVSAAKNAALPLLAASLLSAEPVVLENVPRLADITTIQALLQGLGTEIEERDGATVVRTPALRSVEAPYELVADHARLGARAGAAAGPGRPRPGLAARRLRDRRAPDRPAPQGARAARGRDHARARLRRGRGRRGSAARRSSSTRVTVTGTENLMMAAALAEGTTVLENAAREPEVEDLARAAHGDGRPASTAPAPTDIEIEGVDELGGATSPRSSPTAIEAGTFLVAGAITGGDVTVRGRDARAPGRRPRRSSRRSARTWRSAPSGCGSCGRPAAGRSTSRPSPYPGFPTDMQAQIMVLLVRWPTAQS